MVYTYPSGCRLDDARDFAYDAVIIPNKLTLSPFTGKGILWLLRVRAISDDQLIFMIKMHGNYHH